jgi:hypothetical protein
MLGAEAGAGLADAGFTNSGLADNFTLAANGVASDDSLKRLSGSFDSGWVAACLGAACLGAACIGVASSGSVGVNFMVGPEVSTLGIKDCGSGFSS